MVKKQNKKYSDENIFVKVVDEKCIPLIYSGDMSFEDAKKFDYHVGHGSTYFVDENGFFNFYKNNTLKGAKKDRIFDTIDKIKNKCTYMMRNTAIGFYQGKEEFIYHKKGLNADITTLDQTRRKTVFIPGGEPNIVSFLGYKIGIEICQDHDIGLLSKLNKGEKVDLHFILSSSVDKRVNHLHASKKGFVIQSDRCKNISGVFDCKGNKMKPMKNINLKTKVSQHEKTLCIYACTIDA